MVRVFEQSCKKEQLDSHACEQKFDIKLFMDTIKVFIMEFLVTKLHNYSYK